jgi:hypothetical protein
MENYGLDGYFLEIIKGNIVVLTVVYWTLKGMFPDSRFLKAIGDAFKKIPIPGRGNKKS